MISRKNRPLRLEYLSVPSGKLRIGRPHRTKGRAPKATSWVPSLRFCRTSSMASALRSAIDDATVSSAEGTTSRRHAAACTSMAVSPATAVELPSWNEGQHHPAKLLPDRRIVVQNVVQLAPEKHKQAEVECVGR